MSSLEIGHLDHSKTPVKLRLPSGEGFQLTILGSSGSGKTHTLYRIIEMIPQGRPIFIADVEQDFLSLRKHRDFVLVGKGRDIPADPAAAELLAKRFLELRFSIIFDAFEEKNKEKREEFLQIFLETLHDAPRKLWQPASIILDELDIWAPEKGEGEALSTNACAYAAKRFRKRHFDLVMATQRPAAVKKDVIAQSRNWLVGLTNIDTDIKRSLSFLGFTEKEDRARYRDLQRGEFFARGPDLGLRHPEKILVGPAALFEKSAVKAAAEHPPAPHGEVKKLIDELKELPAKAEEEAKDLAALKSRIRELERELKTSRAAASKPVIDEKKVDRAVAAARKELIREFQRKVKKLNYDLSNAIGPIVDGTVKSFPEFSGFDARDSAHIVATVRNVVTPPRAPRAAKADGEEKALGKGERKILKFLAMREGTAFTKAQLAPMVGFANSGTFGTYVSRLTSAGLVVPVGGGKVQIADPEEARKILGEEYHAPEQPALEAWLSELGGGAKRIYEAVLAYPNREFSKEELAEMTGFSNSGTYGTYLSRLCSLGLLKRTGSGLKLNEELLEV